MSKRETETANWNLADTYRRAIEDGSETEVEAAALAIAKVVGTTDEDELDSFLSRYADAFRSRYTS